MGSGGRDRRAFLSQNEELLWTRRKDPLPLGDAGGRLAAGSSQPFPPALGRRPLGAVSEANPQAAKQCDMKGFIPAHTV